MQRFMQFMQGRYGNDKLNIGICVVGCVLTLLLSILRVPWYFRFLTYIPFLIVLWRSLSKNIYKRQRENEVFLRFWTPWGRFFSKKVNHAKDSEHKYFNCPQCSHTLRVPRGRGKIEITCPFCGRKFKKRT